MRSIFLMLFLFASISLSAAVEKIDKVVIWGHKLHSHTHSYIHNAFYHAFKYLKYETYWFDNGDDVSHFDFTNALFITEGQVDGKIPVRDDCFYILHNCSSPKYIHQRTSGKAISLQVYTDDVLKYNTQEIAKCIHFDVPGKIVYMPWATDLFPEQINQIKATMPLKKWEDKVYWIGTVGAGYFGNIEQIKPFMKACKKDHVEFIARGGTSCEENQRLIGRSYMAPTIVGEWQQRVGYIPCRIFKNISYGQMGITNSYRVYDLFDQKIVYNADTYQLYYDAKKAMKKTSLKELFTLMDVVRDKHTYINRIETLLQFLDLVAEDCGG